MNDIPKTPRDGASLVAPMIKNPPAMRETWVRSPGQGIGYPLQYSGLENSMDRRALQATVHGITKSQTWLSLSLVHFQWMIFQRPQEITAKHLIRKDEFLGHCIIQRNQQCALSMGSWKNKCNDETEDLRKLLAPSQILAKGWLPLTLLGEGLGLSWIFCFLQAVPRVAPGTQQVKFFDADLQMNE